MINILVNGDISKELFKEIMELIQSYLNKIKDYREIVSTIYLYKMCYTI